MKLILLALFVAAAPALSWAIDSPKESFREADRVLSEARQAEHDKNNDLAWQRCLEAKKLFEAIQRNHPIWSAEAVAARVRACAAGSEKTAPLMVRELDQEIRELKLLSANMDELRLQKLDMLKDVDWVYNFINDRIERYVVVYARDRATVSEEAEEAGEEGVIAGEKGSAAALEETRSTPIGITPTLDFDRDGLSDEEEARLGTNPADSDTDNDGITDADEIRSGFDPRDASDHPEADEMIEYDESDIHLEEEEGGGSEEIR